MKIDIEVSNSMCQLILDKFGYVSEKVVLYYDPMSDVRGIDDAPVEELRGMECLIAYPAGARPEFLDEERPLTEDCENIMYDGVVKSLFNSWLISTMLKHEPY